MALPQFTTGTIAEPSVMNAMVNDINANTSAIGQMSNSPININPDFKIWQRYNASDTTTFTNPVNKYIADRYRFNGTGTVKPVVNGAEIIGAINVKYILEDSEFQKLNGKTLTRSWSENGVIQKETFVCNGATIFDKTISNKIVNYIKLELGEIATPFVPRTYAEELAMCQRYYETMPLTPFFIGSVATTYNIIAIYKYTTKKRVSPTVVMSDELGNVGKCIRGVIGSTQISGQPVNLNPTSSMDALVIESVSGASANYMMMSAMIDAEIY